MATIGGHAERAIRGSPGTEQVLRWSAKSCPRFCISRFCFLLSRIAFPRNALRFFLFHFFLLLVFLGVQQNRLRVFVYRLYLELNSISSTEQLTHFTLQSTSIPQAASGDRSARRGTVRASSKGSRCAQSNSRVSFALTAAAAQMT